mmetsp:Transcript_38394/g.83201  ORF Transcript_38394/g.83201 Transcript_38394/m.83201 type:complete len:196 (+) Transcript_38394:37-624(+)
MNTPPVNVPYVAKVSEIVQVLSRTTHNGFPVVGPARDARGRPSGPVVFKGTILRTQLIVLLSHRAFLNSPECRMPGAKAPVPTEEEHHLDLSMRTYHHRHSFHARAQSAGAAKIAAIGLTPQEMEQWVDLQPYTHKHPLAAHREFPLWKAYTYFRAMGLRHLAVVDDQNCVVGVVTRRDFSRAKDESQRQLDQVP